MQSIYDIKPKFQNLLRPLCSLLAKKGIKANQITLLAVGLSVLYGIILIYLRPPQIILLLMPIILFIRMAFNAIDGILAREFGQKSKLGAILNELGDVVSDIFLYLPLAIYFPAYLGPILAFVLLSVISEMTGVVAVQVGSERRYDGPMGKSDRALWIGGLCLISGLGVMGSCGVSGASGASGASIGCGSWVGIFFYILIYLLLLTIYNRAKNALGK